MHNITPGRIILKNVKTEGPTLSSSQQEIASPQPESEGKEQKQAKSKYFTTKRIATLAVMVALSIVIKIIGNTLTFTQTFRVSFIYIPWLLSGILFGPIGGCLVSGLSDLLVILMGIGGQFIPLTFVSNLLYPLFIGLIFTFVKGGNVYVKILLGMLMSLIICTLGIGSLALYTFYKYNESYGFFEYLFAYRFIQIGVLAINAVILCLLVRPLENIGIFPESKEKFIFNKQIVFLIGEAVLLLLYISGIVALYINEAQATLYLLISLYYVLLAALVSLILWKNFSALAKIIIWLGVFAIITALGATANSLSNPDTLYITILLSSASGILAASAIVVLITKKLTS